jgi:hypothetical protein
MSARSGSRNGYDSARNLAERYRSNTRNASLVRMGSMTAYWRTRSSGSCYLFSGGASGGLTGGQDQTPRWSAFVVLGPSRDPARYRTLEPIVQDILARQTGSACRKRGQNGNGILTPGRATEWDESAPHPWTPPSRGDTSPNAPNSVATPKLADRQPAPSQAHPDTQSALRPAPRLLPHPRPDPPQPLPPNNDSDCSGVPNQPAKHAKQARQARLLAEVPEAFSRIWRVWRAPLLNSHQR